jgi:Lrp/AsnC family transcriptional regulator for asnA, asnC and gidA
LTENPEPDNIDQKIISHLQTDGRMTFEELGKRIGYTGMGVKKRVKKLVDNDIIKISTMLNPKSLSLHSALVLLEMENAEAMQKLLQRFEECPRVIYIFTTLGGYNLIALVAAENQDTLESISMEKCSLRSAEGIRRSEFYPIGDIHYSSFLPIRRHLAQGEKIITPCGVDCKPCRRYQSRLCVGCPATQWYQGRYTPEKRKDKDED